jgi:hypothetical protein
MNKLAMFLLVCIVACADRGREDSPASWTRSFRQFSNAVQDSFHIQVQLPRQYFEYPEARYTTVLLLDGNFFSPMVSSMLHQYEKAGLLRPLILVSIGYRSFATMDSLRVRDYLFPKALPSDELEAVGGGERFNRYIREELLPHIDSAFRTNPSSRCLLGHSFGGYFVLYSLLDQLEHQRNTFQTFVAASPTVWYNDFYLKRLERKIVQNRAEDLNIFITVGDLEDSTWSIAPVESLYQGLQRTGREEVNLRYRRYTHLDHMDVGILSFTQGLQELK